MLRLVNQKLATASGVLASFFSSLWKPIAYLLRLLVGSWQPPAWLRWFSGILGQSMRWLQQRLLLVFAIIAVLIGCWFVSPELIKWWHGLTPEQVEPVEVASVIHAPQRTRVEDKALPNPVRIEFKKEVAPIDQIDKEAVGISMEPAMPGKWIWVQANRVEFTPETDWPVGQSYTIRISDHTLAPHVRSTKSVFQFSAPAFGMNIASAEFYQDPTQANVRRALFMVQFTHPVNTAELEKRIAMSYDKPCESSLLNLGTSPCARLQYTLQYDKWKQLVTIQSEPLPIPEKGRPVVLKISEGTTASRGGAGIASDTTRSVSIPGLYALSIKDVRTNIVTGENGDPEYVLNVSTSMPVHEREMARAVQVWMLPAQQKEDESQTKGFFNWSSARNAINDEVLARSQKIALEAIPGEQEVSDTVSFRLPAAQGGHYLLARVTSGVKSPGGYQLEKARQQIIRLSPFTPQLSIMSQGSLLALSGDKKLPILVRDLPGVKVEIGRLLPMQLQHLVTQSSGDFSRPDFYNNISSDNLVDRFEKRIPLHLQQGKAHYEAIDFSTYLNKNATERRGIFLLKVTRFNPVAEANKAEEAERAEDENAVPAVDNAEDDQHEGTDDEHDYSGLSDRRLIIVTDLGLVVKKSLSGVRDVYVQSIANGQPIAGAQVEVWGRNGVPIASQSTDATGHASVPNLAGYQREKAPAVLVVRKGADLSFLPFNRNDRTLDVSRFDVGGLYAAGVPNQMTGHVFSDRGMYRPGDTMHIAMIVKAGKWNTSLKDLPMEAEIIDARGLSVRREKLRLGPGGTAEIAHTTEESSPTGNYTVNLYLPRQSSNNAPEVQGLLVGSTTVKVQEFMPDRTKVKLTLSSQVPEGWVRPADLKAQVDVQNLFGTPAPDRKVEGTLTLTPAFPAFRSHADYSFFDPLHAGEMQTDDLGTVQTSAEGLAEFNLRLARFASATYQVRVLAKAFEPEGGRSVSAEVQTLVSDLPYLVGVKVDGDVSYVSKGAARHASIIAINPQAQKTSVSNLKLQRVERKVLSVLVKQNNGVFRYESRRKEVLLEDAPLSIADSGNALTLDTTAPGDYAYVLRNEQDQILNRIDYSVAGNANVTRALDRNAELQLTLDRKDYEPGQEISVSIRAPYVGAGLITIEREKVYAHAWFKTDKTASVQKITVPKDFEGTGYLTVHFIRDPASDEIYMSPLSYGVVPFATTLSKRTANITLTSTELIKPGQTMKMTLTSDKPTRAVVFAVDEGILQVARYKTPDPLKHFFQKRALEVSTLQTLDLILPEFKRLMQGAAPGGDAEGDLGKHLNPFKRKRDKPVAYWSGLVDVQGTREFTYTVPERFNGSLRVMAVAVNDDATAAKSTSTTVRGDLVILPNAPLAMSPGDTVEVGVGVANNMEGSGKQVPIALTLAASQGLEVVGEATQTLSINERGEASTKFKVRAKSGGNAVLGSAPLSFSASYKSQSVRLTEEVSVRPASPFVSLVQAGSFQRSGEIKSQSDFFPNFRKSDIAVSSAPWAFATGLMQYLESYPHGCTEQITSQTYPAVLLATRPELLKEMQHGRTPEQGPWPAPRETWNRYVAQLRTRQTSDGGISLWPGSASDPFPTIYAVQLLLDAKQHQLPVPQDMLEQANSYLRRWLGDADTSLDGWRQRTQAVYLLTRQGIVAPAALANLREAWRSQKGKGWEQDLGAAYLAASYQLVKQDKVAEELMEPVWSDLQARAAKKQRRNVWGHYYDPLVHDSVTLNLVARHFPARLKGFKPEVWETMAAMLRDGWYNSLSSASMLLAVDAYFDAVGHNAEGKLSVQALNAQRQASTLALGSVNPVTRSAVPPGTQSLKLANDSDFNLYYSWTEQGFERNLPETAINKGMEIIHDVLDANGKPVTRVKLGEEVTVRVRVRSLEQANLESVALVDMLPGGLEPVLQSVNDDGDEESEQSQEPIWKRRLAGKGSWNVQYADIREDRVVFYGSVGKDLVELSYQARATNIGEFVVPPAYGEAMYDRRVFARSAASKLQIVGK